MEPVFEIRNIISPKRLIEYYSRATRGVRYFTYAAFVLVTLYAFWNGVLLQVAENIVLYAVLCIPAVCLTPHLVVWMAMRSVKKDYGGNLPESTITVGDVIRVRQDMTETSVEYHRITSVEHLKHSYLLQAGKTTAILIDPQSFTKGTFAEFKQFLREKRPDLTIPE